MSADSPLDLSQLDPMVWRILSRGEAHGPYTLAQVRSYISNGRIGPGTRVSANQDAPFLPALHQPKLTPVFEELNEQRNAERAKASNFVIVIRSELGSINETRAHASKALNPLGKFAETMPGVYILRAAMRVNDLRTALTKDSDSPFQMMIAEAPDGRLGWHGLDSTMDSRLRNIWNAPLED